MKPLALLLSGYVLLLGAWVLGNPPAAAPDEYAHYLKALAAGRGELLPEKRQGPLIGGDRNKLYLRWMYRQTRMIKVNDRLSPDRINCPRNGASKSWLCPLPPPVAKGTSELRSWVGTYPPFMYAIPGTFMRLGSDTVPALLWGRFGFALQSVALLGLAARALWNPDESGLGLLGLTAAVTPMVIFVASSLSASGSEAAAGICFGAGLLSFGRSEKPSKACWLALGIGGAALALSRDLGVIWIALGLLILAGLEGPSGVWARMKSSGTKAVATAAGLGIASIVAVIWQLKVQVRPSVPLAQYLSEFTNSLPVTKEIARQEIGVFGSLNTVMPPAAYWAWALVLAGLGALAIWLGNMRQRLVLGLAFLSAIVLPVALDITQRSVQFGVQGRHVLPFTVMVPLLAGELVFRRGGEVKWLQKLRLSVFISAAAAAVYMAAWYFNARIQMVGADGPVDFWTGLSSEPPLGWLPLGVMAGVGCLAVFGAGLAAALRPSQA